MVEKHFFFYFCCCLLSFLGSGGPDWWQFWERHRWGTDICQILCSLVGIHWFPPKNPQQLLTVRVPPHCTHPPISPTSLFVSLSKCGSLGILFWYWGVYFFLWVLYTSTTIRQLCLWDSVGIKCARSFCIPMYCPLLCTFFCFAVFSVLFSLHLYWEMSSAVFVKKEKEKKGIEKKKKKSPQILPVKLARC